MNTYLADKTLRPTTMSDGDRGYEAFYEFTDVLDKCEYHCHDYYEIYIHLHGGQYYGISEKLYQLKPNQLFIVPPYVMHGLTFEGVLTGYERAYLNISMNVLKVLGFGRFDLDEFFRSYTASGLNTFQMSPSEAEIFVKGVRRLSVPSPTKNSLSEYSSYNELSRILHEVCCCMERSSAITDTAAPGGVMQEVLTYINSNYTQPIKIPELARRFGVSVSYLAREFVKLTHRSVYEYILYCRVNYAKQLMRSELNLNAIAYQCGFGDYSNFLRIFNKTEGVSPAIYRRHLKGENA